MKKKRKNEQSRTIDRLFYVAPTDIHKDVLFLRSSEAYHASKVLRLKEGDACNAFDGEGNLFRIRISHIVKTHDIQAEIIHTEKISSSNGPFISIAQAMPRKGKFDFILEKATELGVATIIPLVTERTEYRIDLAEEEKMRQRWEKIVLQAAKQSHHYQLPVIRAVHSFEDMTKSFSEYSVVLMPSPERREHLQTILSDLKGIAPSHVLIMIGPEGGFSDNERNLAAKCGAYGFSLGKTILKTDTAMILTVGVIKTYLELYNE
jgi:16S rRNA (uracil1498-N3)-methyltransferase